MGEIGTRWIIGMAAILAAVWLEVPAFGFVAIVALVWALASTVLLRFDRKDPGVAGFIATLDGLAIACLLSGTAWFGALAWIAALPAVHAVVLYRARPLATASLAAGAILLAQFDVPQTLPNPLILIQCAGVLALGWLLRPIPTAEKMERTRAVAAPQRAVATDSNWMIDDAKQAGILLDGEAFRARMDKPGTLVLFEFGARDVRHPSEIACVSQSLLERALNFLPSRGSVYLRDDGEVLVHLHGCHLAEASNWAQRVAQGQTGVRARTASLWPPTNVVISIADVEPETVRMQSIS